MPSRLCLQKTRLSQHDGSPKPQSYLAAAFVAKLKIVSTICFISSDRRAAMPTLCRFPPPDNETSEDSDAPNPLMKASGTPALSEKSKGKSRRCRMLDRNCVV